MNKFIQKYKITILFLCTVFLFTGGLVLVSTFLDDINDKKVVDAGPDDKKPSDPVNAIVDEEQEILLKYPYSGDLKTVRYYYDSSNEEAKLAASLDYFENTYRPSVGMSFAKENGEGFDVIAMIPGTISHVGKDSIFGYCITIKGENGLTVTYQSMGSTNVKENDKVKQGDMLGTSGENIYQSELGNHIHIILDKDGKTVNMEKYFNQPIKGIK